MFQKILRNLADVPSGIIPLVLVECGSFSPPHFAHLRNLEVARKVIDEQHFCVVGGLISPVGSAYKKPNLASTEDRLAMCHLAVESSDWIDVDDWEASQPTYTRTANVLDSISNRLNTAAQALVPKPERIQLRLVCGADLLESMTRPGVWDLSLLAKLFSFGMICINRDAVNTQAMVAHEILAPHREHIQLVPEEFSWHLSSSFIRQELHAGRSIKYLAPDSVLQYIAERRLFA
ncbi:putative nicotinamide/nicotinic acid mononucleotide adenylyltransferase [Paratrimastix pyriformis]|uniref:Nicotinamide-nucleotide adenylyltransferase n=1 Tax=Paratrimastix pyriformis TaxID=342808 RepID=A0ABQ8UBN3_9EUKA|nr:putative nicotinamide/nicotinic acid mononucleotide adenylyltransferase [Paratrimastix pyriformis]